MTFEEWYKAEGHKLMSSGKSVKECLYEAFVSGWSEGFAEANQDKEYDV